jgi:hypothetical protein
MKIAFTNESPYGGGENKTDKVVYCLFAYIVSNSGDIPLRSVFSLNKGNKEKLKVAREEKVCLQEGKTSRRMTRKPDYYRSSSK